MQFGNHFKKIILLEYAFKFPLIMWSFFCFQNSLWLCIHFWINLELRRVGKNIQNKDDRMNSLCNKSGSLLANFGYFGYFARVRLMLRSDHGWFCSKPPVRFCRFFKIKPDFMNLNVALLWFFPPPTSFSSSLFRIALVKVS